MADEHRRPRRTPRPSGDTAGQLIIDARNIAVTFKVEDGTVEAVKDVSFQLHHGETIAIVGESGSGKSVTARTIMGLLTKRATVCRARAIIATTATTC